MVINNYKYKKFEGDYLITNDQGRFCFLHPQDFYDFCQGSICGSSKQLLIDEGFLSDEPTEIFVSHEASDLRDYKKYYFMGPMLHIFVLTSACNMQCVYCQASTNKNIGYMTFDTAEKCVDIAFQSPSNHLIIEFQGGEPLLNFDTLKHIVEYAEQKRGNRIIEYNLVSNLIALNEEMISFFKQYKVSISTSLDGNPELQNTNRPFAGGNSFEEWKKKYKALTCAGVSSSAIQTTTKQSLPQYKKIIDQYVKEGFNSVFIRPLTPLGYARNRWDNIGYTPGEFLDFYKNALDYIININLAGRFLCEGHAQIFLNKILNFNAGNYMELRSPCGAVIGQLAYNYDGCIYTCDEGRMMAEMGNYLFKVGDINSSLDDIVNCDVCKSMVISSCLECLPECSDCAYSPYCGVCPILNYEEYGSIFATRPGSTRCKIYKGMLDQLFSYIHKSDQEIMQIFDSWCR